MHKAQAIPNCIGTYKNTTKMLNQLSFINPRIKTKIII